MEVRTYFGQYSLMHWIDLILQKNIELPPYQRYFVWSEEKAKLLIESLKNKQFIPPVTIGTFIENGHKKNYILDGQQRLTSILLSALGYFPDREKFKKVESTFRDEGDVPEEFYDNDIIEWKFSQLLSKDKNELDEIKEELQNNEYFKKFETQSNNFLYSHFLSFSFIILDSDDESEQQKYFASTFRNINYQGKALEPIESRDALYYMNASWKPLFIPDIKFFKKEKIDFVRYISLLSQYYKKGKSTNGIAYGYSRKMELYYEHFIYNVIDKTYTNLFGDFETYIPQKELKKREQLLEENISLINLNFGKNSSIIDLDLFLFGIINYSIFLNKKISKNNIESIKNKILEESQKFKNDNAHARTPSVLRFLYSRIEKSIEIFGEV